MSDQAQGLRLLADQVRFDHGDTARAPISTPVSAGITPTGPTGRASREPLSAPINAEYAVADHRLHAQSAPRSEAIRPARIIAVTSGKGGVGKSNFSANLSVMLGQRNKRVILLDADMGLANAHILLGASPPYSLEHVMLGSRTVTEVLHSAAGNVRLIAGGSGIAELANLTRASREKLLVGLRELDRLCDLIVIDTGAGVAGNVLAFLCAVNEIIVVTTPEPTAITNAYATIKVVSQENPGVRLMLVVNMVHSTGEGAAVADRLRAISRQFLDREVEYLGCIPIDPMIPRAVRKRVPFVCDSPGGAASGAVHQIMGKLGYEPEASIPQPGADGFVTRVQRFFGIRGAP